jgi:hypothetical protein
VLNFSTNHAFIEQLLVEPTLDLYFSQDDLLDVPCDKDDLCDNASTIHVLKPHTCAELNILFILLAQTMSSNYCLL